MASCGSPRPPTATLLFFLNYVLLHLKPLSDFDLTIVLNVLSRVNGPVFPNQWQVLSPPSPLGAPERDGASLIILSRFPPWLSQTFVLHPTLY